ncbi:DNA glycosylase [Pseudoneurospora amorphoporcata]|uniref:DNA-(apurinic or apyrimidinic site) lyase n=1 Tax=Pseudoneurospora amorphoporcata TaxID=241081 RepID=A0AAN6NW94_9PEZI|nr:DNA glycosylase [Pseudoneurospora amorphoporcata]
MAAQKVSEWRKLPVSLTELCIETTLRCGQSFRWRKINEQWHCVLQGRLISLRQDPTHLHYKVTWPTTTPTKHEDPQNFGAEDDTPSLLHSYFALSRSLTTLYAQWSLSDANFARRAPAFTGIRILNQDAWETLISFICSSNNNISRISQMVLKLCTHYGPYVATVEGEAFHDFPGPEALAGEGVEAHLRELGFGYRAKYIAETAGCVAQVYGEKWLLRLRDPGVPALGATTEEAGASVKKEEGAEEKKKPVDGDSKVDLDEDPPTYKKAHAALLALPGVGPKVSDCVCLMGLGWGESVPIDTHVWQIAQRDYNFGGKGGAKTKTLNKTMYEAVGDHFREIWGPQAGWAQSVLFTANLKSFSEQAAVVKKEGVVKVEEETQEETVTTAEAVTKPEKKKGVVVKVEKSEEIVATTSAVKSRKRKTVAAEVLPKSEPDAAVQTTTTRTLRSSKRIKSQV